MWRRLMTRHISPDADLSGLFGPAWTALQAHLPDLPDCVIKPPCPGGREDFRAAIGVPGDTYATLTVKIGVSCLLSDPVEAFRLLAHEAVHALDWKRYGKVSGHEERFAELARGIGLTAERRRHSASYDVRLNDEVCTRYADAIRELTTALPEAQQWVIQLSAADLRSANALFSRQLSSFHPELAGQGPGMGRLGDARAGRSG
jgi:hypothetical protein